MIADFSNTRPIYKQIEDMLLLSIARGNLAPGTKVSTVRELAASLKVNPNTVQKSLTRLEEMGYLYTERTSGRYVTQDEKLISALKANLPREITEAYLKEMQECGITPDEVPAYVASFIESKAERTKPNE